MLIRKILKVILRPDLMTRAVKRRGKRLARMIGDGSFAWNPEVLYVIVNNTCNGRCLMCDIGQANRNSSHYQNLIAGDEDLRVADFQKLISEVAFFRPEICFGGVEPLLHREIGRLVAIARNAGLRAILTTNGSLLAKRAEGLVEGDIDEVMVSLDGLQADHDAIRGPGMFEAAIEGIRAVQHWRGVAGASRPKIKVNFCISEFNFSGLVDFADWMFRRIGVDVVGFTHLNFVTPELSRLHNERFAGVIPATPLSMGVDPRKVDTDVLWEQVAEIGRRFDPARVIFDVCFRERESLTAHYHDPTSLSGRHPCSEPWLSATMRANGDFLIRSRCVPYLAGNIREQSFARIWRGEKYRRFRRTLKKAGFFPVCARCCGTL